MNLAGRVSWFGGPRDPTDSGHTATGGTTKEPGIAVYNHGTLGGYWRVTGPNGRTAVLRQTDIGPAPWTGRKIDVTYSALGKFGFNEGNFPTDSEFKATYLGRNPGSTEAATTAPTPSPRVPGTPSRQVTEVNQPALEQAKRASIIGKLLVSSGEGKDNPLLASGLATTKMPVASEYEGTRTIPGTPAREALPQAHPSDEPKLAGIIANADKIAQAKVPYLWGGGHQGRVLASTHVTPLDCSGAVSSALGINPKVSGEFESWGAPGKGAHLTIYANGHHVLMEVNGKFWGTSSSNPGGGAGWIKPGVITPGYLKQFTARHPADERIVAMHGPNPVVRTGGGHTVYVPR